MFDQVSIIHVVNLQYKVKTTRSKTSASDIHLSPEDGDAVLAPVGALAALKHAAAIVMIVVQSSATDSVSMTDPLGNSTGDDGLIARGSGHVGSAHLYTLLGLTAHLVRALTLEQAEDN